VDNTQNNPVIVKSSSWPGIDRSIVDFDTATSVKVAKSKVILSLYKKGALSFIGIQDGLQSGEVIQTGDLGIKYKIIGGAIKMLPTGGFLYRVKRVDGFNITLTDINASHVGDIVKIKNRRSFQQQIDQIITLLDL
jgi:hypothetical protein